MRTALSVVGFTLLAAGSSLAQVPFGPEAIISASTSQDQRVPSVVSDAAGNFVVAWERSAQYYGVNIVAQRFDAAGRPRGAELQVNQQTILDSFSLALAGAIDGSFVVAWTSGYDGDSGGIAARRFGTSGTPLGPEFGVNTYITSFQYEPQVAMDGVGNFIVVWSGNGTGDDEGVFAQRFDSAGNRRGGEFRVNTYTTYFQKSPSVAVAPSGAFLVVWNNFAWQGDSWEVFGRRYDAQGTPQGSEFHINTHTTGFQFSPKAVADGAGNFVVVWDDVDRGLLAGRRYDPAGNPLGAEFTVPGYPSNIRLAAAANGSFVVVWEGYPRAIDGKRFDAAGNPGPTLRVNLFGGGLLTEPSVAMLPQGFVVAWPDRDSYTIFSRRFGDLGPSALAVDATATGGSDGNRVLEPGETVAVQPTWANSTAAPRPASGLASQFTGPGAPNPSYSITDAQASYGTLPPGGTAGCAAANNCYGVALGVPTVRPAVHWDARMREDVTASGLLPAQTWTMHVGDSFSDVARASLFYPFVETLLHNSVTTGCQGSLYCPALATTREQMAVFVLRAAGAPWYRPWECNPGGEDFDDVPASSPFCAWIEELARRGVVTGCGPGLYCPTAAVTREQMAVFVLRTLDPTLSPPACVAGSEMFADVPASSAFCRWIEELVRRAVVTGCGGGNYCPAAAVTREQMSVFLTATFGLTLYGP